MMKIVLINVVPIFYHLIILSFPLPYNKAFSTSYGTGWKNDYQEKDKKAPKILTVQSSRARSIFLKIEFSSW